MNTLAEARGKRIDEQLDEHIDGLLIKANLAIPVTAKIKLRDVLKKYAKDPNPFRACVKGEMGKFGPGRVESVCASLKQTIKTNKNFSKGSANMGDVIIDGDVLLALDAVSEIDLQEIFLEARALEEHGTIEAVALMGPVTGKSELETWGAR